MKDEPFIMMYGGIHSSEERTYKIEILKRRDVLSCNDCAMLAPMQPCEACVNNDAQVRRKEYERS